MGAEGGNSLLWRMGLIDDDFRDGLVKAGEGVETLNRSAEAIGRGLAGGAMVEWAKRTTDAAAATLSMARNLEISTDALQAFQFKVREANGSSEEANRVLETTRAKLDELKAGSEPAIESFAKLGLTAEDFVGLSLDQSLEKVARAYTENADRAGAYAALQEIVGRSGRDLTGVLKELGDEGMGTFVKQAKEAHAVMDSGLLSDLTELKKNFEIGTNAIKTWGGTLLGYLNGSMEVLGALFGELWQFGEALLVGGPFSEKGRAQMKAAVDATIDVLDKIGSKEGLFSQKAKETTTALEAQREPLRESSQLIAERAKYEELMNKLTAESADSATKLATLDAQIKEHVAAAAAGSDQLRAQKELNKAAELEIEFHKAKLDYQQRQLDMKLKELEAQRSLLPLWEQGSVLAKEQSAVNAEIARYKKEHLDTSKLENDALAIKQRMNELNKQIVSDEVKATQDLLSNDRLRNEEGRIHLQLLNGEITQQQVQSEAEGLLAKMASGLTDSERLRLEALVSQLTYQQKQAELQSILANGVDNLTEQDKKRLAVLTGQTEQLTKQKQTVDSIISAWDGFTTSASNTSNPANQTTEQLQYEATNLKKQLEQLRLEDRSGQFFDAATGNAVYGTPALVQQSLANIQKELDERRSFELNFGAFGQASAQQLFQGSPQEFQRLLQIANQDLAAKIGAQTEQVTQINQRLAKIV